MSLSYLLPSYVYMTTNIWSYFRISRMAKMFCGVLTVLYHSHYRNSFAGISLLQIQNMAGILLMRKDRDNWCLLTILSILKIFYLSHKLNCMWTCYIQTVIISGVKYYKSEDLVWKNLHTKFKRFVWIDLRFSISCGLWWKTLWQNLLNI